MDVTFRALLELFRMAFAISKFSFCGALLKRILAWERGISNVVLNFVSYSSCALFTRVALVKKNTRSKVNALYFGYFKY